MVAVEVTMTRKEFLGSLIGAMALLACSEDSDTGGDVAGGGGAGGTSGGGGGGGTNPDAAVAKSCTANSANVTIGTNHGHVMTVSPADVAAGAAKTYDITGTSQHAHMVTVTAANFAALQSNPNGSVMVTSTTGGAHTHVVTIVCA
jgi:hypothetical protein